MLESVGTPTLYLSFSAFVVAAIAFAASFAVAIVRRASSAVRLQVVVLTATWTRPFRVAGGVHALKQILRRQLIGLTYSQERQIRVPAAVLYGAADPELTAAQAKATAARLHTTRIVAIPGARHLGMLSDPDIVAADIAAFAGGSGVGLVDGALQ